MIRSFVGTFCEILLFCCFNYITQLFWREGNLSNLILFLFFEIFIFHKALVKQIFIINRCFDKTSHPLSSHVTVLWGMKLRIIFSAVSLKSNAFLLTSTLRNVFCPLNAIRICKFIMPYFSFIGRWIKNI